VSYPSVEQFSLDLETLHHMVHPTPLPGPHLLPVLWAIKTAYQCLLPTERPNAAYELYLSTGQRALSAFRAALDIRLKIEPPKSVFSYPEMIDFTPAYAAFTECFRDNAAEFQNLGMFGRGQLYPPYWGDYGASKPRFTEKEPIYGDQYERRAWRARQKEFFEDDLKPWEEARKLYDKEKAEFEKHQTGFEHLFYGTPFVSMVERFAQFEEVSLPLNVTMEHRFQHQWVIADSGHGKTQMLQQMIVDDLSHVERGKRSVVVIDSQNKLIPTIAKLRVFAPGQPLHGKLTVLNPADTDLALNLFDLNFRPKADPRQQQAVINATLEMYSFMLGSLLDRPMTSKQRTLFEYTALLLFRIERATIRTFRDIMRKDGIERYRSAIEQLKPGSAVREFFEHDFSSKEYAQTKDEVVGRIATLLLNPTFEAMFTQPENRLDMLSEINAGKVVLINTSQHLLKRDGVKFFGRFMLALIANAVAERGDISDADKTPTLVYLDEAYEYIKDDLNIVTMLAQARKQRVGIVAAQQWLGQLDEPVYEAFAAIASIIFAGGVSQSDAYKLAPMMKAIDPVTKAMDVSFITDQPKLHFAGFVKGLTKTAVTVPIAYGVMEAMHVMTDAEYAEQKEFMAYRYGVSVIDYDLYWEMTINPVLARDGGKTREHGFILTIPAGLQDGEVLRLRNKGREKPDGSFGHIFITVNVPRLQQPTEAIPSAVEEPSEATKKAW
jgi:hypothetical protein